MVGCTQRCIHSIIHESKWKTICVSKRFGPLRRVQCSGPPPEIISTSYISSRDLGVTEGTQYIIQHPTACFVPFWSSWWFRSKTERRCSHWYKMSLSGANCSILTPTTLTLTHHYEPVGKSHHCWEDWYGKEKKVCHMVQKIISWHTIDMFVF